MQKDSIHTQLPQPVHNGRCCLPEGLLFPGHGFPVIISEPDPAKFSVGPGPGIINPAGIDPEGIRDGCFRDGPGRRDPVRRRLTGRCCRRSDDAGLRGFRGSSGVSG